MLKIKSNKNKLWMLCSAIMLCLISFSLPILVGCSNGDNNSYIIDVPNDLKQHQNLSMNIMYCEKEWTYPNTKNVVLPKGFSWVYRYDTETTVGNLSALFSAPNDITSITIPNDINEVYFYFIYIPVRTINIKVPSKINVYYSHLSQDGEYYTNEKGEEVSNFLFKDILIIYLYTIENSVLDESVINITKY